MKLFNFRSSYFIILILNPSTSSRVWISLITQGPRVRSALVGPRRASRLGPVAARRRLYVGRRRDRPVSAREPPRARHTRAPARHGRVSMPVPCALPNLELLFLLLAVVCVTMSLLLNANYLSSAGRVQISCLTWAEIVVIPWYWNSTRTLFLWLYKYIYCTRNVQFLVGTKWRIRCC